MFRFRDHRVRTAILTVLLLISLAHGGSAQQKHDQGITEAVAKGLSRPMHLCMVIDEGQFPWLLTFLHSLHQSNKDDRIIIHLLYVDTPVLNETRRRELTAATAAFGDSKAVQHIWLDWVEVPSLFASFAAYQQPRDMPHLSQSQATMWRLFAGTLLPRMERIIYIDLDTLVFGSLRELYDETPPNNSCGITARSSPSGAQMKDSLSKLPFPVPDLQYKAKRSFNAGVLLIDLAVWRARDAERQFFFMANAYGVNDQIILNFFCNGTYSELPAKYNTFTGSARGSAGTDENEPPVIVHYAGRRKPWSHLLPEDPSLPPVKSPLRFQAEWDELYLNASRVLSPLLPTTQSLQANVRIPQTNILREKHPRSTSSTE